MPTPNARVCVLVTEMVLDDFIFDKGAHKTQIASVFVNDFSVHVFKNHLEIIIDIIRTSAVTIKHLLTKKSRSLVLNCEEL